ncbi:hypothetical protein PYW07_006223 [Mythimna separata]|uniref:HTH psq-type domain-containing protein n=1 Tax=Mythimna separata TaxID=271217 RepID=A0AAD7YVX7_MYTSE|nr:hypothetical protein PYW07_006223 [Mythimna separata]
MVNNYKRKSDRQSWREEDMRNAIEKVATRKMGLNKAAATFNVPKTTLIRRLTKYESTKDLTEATEKKMGRYEKVFNVDQERELASYVKNMENRFFGLTIKDLRRLAYELAEKKLVDKAFQKAATLSTAYNAFRATGIWPLNPDVFTEADFLAAATTDIEMPEAAPRDNEPEPIVIRPEETPLIDELGLSVSDDHATIELNRTPPLVNDEIIIAEAGMSSNEGINELTRNDEPQPSTSTSFFIAPKDIMPIPRTSKRTRLNIKRGKTAEITSSPYREELEATKKSQEMKENAKKVKQNLFNDKQGKGKQTNVQKGKGKGKSTKKSRYKKEKHILIK